MKRLRIPCAVAVALALAGCLPFLKPARVPMRTLELARGDGECLVVLLPGRFGGPRDFVRAGFAERMRERGLGFDLLAVDAHLGYYRHRSVVDRLRADVIAPASAAGYREIWLAGVSLGGLGSLLYARNHAEDLAGVLALAPFLGDRDLVAEIRGQGGLRAWHASEDDDFRKLWSWLQSYLGTPSQVPIHLGYGTDDDLAPAAELLAAALPEERVYTRPGGHDWKAWGKLWEDFLDRGDVCAPALND